jgi:glyoxylase I family protein
VTARLGSRVSGTPSLHHVAVGTRDVEALAAFYCRLLSVPEERRHLDESGQLRSVWLNLAGTLLMIERCSPDASERAPVSGVGLGAFLLAFAAGPAGRPAFEARAAELGAMIESRSAFSSYFRDPDGNRLAVSDYEVSS